MLTSEELEKLRKAGRVSGEARELGMSMCEPGVKLYDVAQEVEGYIRRHGCKLAFPCNISRNEVAAHATPGCNDKTVFEVGDIVKIDCGGILDGFIGDTAGTVEVGSRSYPELVEISKTARNTVAEFIGEGVRLCDIGNAVERTIRGAGFAPIVNLSGHQIGKAQLRRSDEQVRSPTEQTVYDRRPAPVNTFKKLCHGHCFEISRVCHPQKFPL